jgi:DNA ligase-1
MNKLPMLYKRNNKNKITQWNVEVIPSSTVTDAYEIITTFGETNGVIQTHTKYLDKGKAKRTVQEQALSEANSKWNEKKNREAFSISIDALGSTRTIRPMLANTFDKTKYNTTKTSKAYKIPFPCYVQRKYDGIRCMAHLEDNRIIMESRKGLAFSHFDKIRQKIAELLTPTHMTLYLDGELYTDLLPFEKINGATRISPGKATPIDLENINKIKYHIYDVYSPENPSLSYKQRMEILEDLNRYLSPTDSIAIVHTDNAESMDNIKRFHDLYVQEGFEGIMLRDPIGTYEIDKRSKYLQKYKEFMEEEFIIVGFHCGIGLDAGLVIWECQTTNGLSFSAKPRGTHEYRRELFENATQYIGKKLTVIFQEYSTDGVPRFPVGKDIRDDV